MRLTILLSTFLFLIILMVSPSMGGWSFNVYPVKVHFPLGKGIENLQITNVSGERATLEIKAMRWLQDESGKDFYEPADELLFYPRIFTVEPGSTQRIKVAYQKKRARTEETFRLFIEEVPMEVVGSTSTALRLTLKMSIPVFIEPDGPKKGGGEIKSITLSLKAATVVLHNSGNEHFSVKKIEAFGQKVSGERVFSAERRGWYVLPGSSVPYSLEIPEGACGKIDTLNVSVQTENTTLQSALHVDTKMCEE